MATRALELPCGVELEGATIERAVEIRKLKGGVLRDIARAASQKNVDEAKILESVLLPSLLSVGAAKPTLSWLLRMLLGDRDWLMWEIRKLTWGDEVTIQQDCGTCGEKVIYKDFNLDENLPVIPLEDDKVLWWNGQETVPSAGIDAMDPADRAALQCRVFVVEEPELDSSGVFRYPTGRAQRAVSGMSKQPLEALWKLMAMSCVSWKDPEHDMTKMPKGGIKTNFWADLDMDILAWAQKAFAEKQPGVQTKVELTCEDGHDNLVRLQAIDFLFPKQVLSI